MRTPLTPSGSLLAAFFCLLPTLPFLSAEAGPIRTFEPGQLVGSKGSTSPLEISGVDFRIWDTRSTITITLSSDTPAPKDCDCENKTLGRLDRPLLLQTELDGKTVQITVPAHRTLVYQSPRGIQIDVKNPELGRVTVDEGPATPGRDALLKRHARDIANQATLIGEVQEMIERKDYPGARVRFSEVATSGELYSAEISRLNMLFELMPPKDRPIDTINEDVRPEIEELGRAFPGVNFDQMTQKSFIGFVENWAKKLYLEQSGDRASGDETYLFRLMGPAGIPMEQQQRLVELTLDTRIDSFLRQAKGGVEVREVSFRDLYVAGIAKSWLEASTSEQAQKYLQELRNRIRSQKEAIRVWMREALLDESL